MNRVLFVLILFPPLLIAQFAELATTNDGGDLYFTSTLRWKGQAPERAESRIYHATGTGAPQLYAERGDLAYKFGGGSGDGARIPQVSGDGQTVALTLEGICDSPGGCNSNTRWRAEIRGRNATILGDGAVYLSGNGRWALLTPHPGIGGPNPAPSPAATLFNLETGERVSVPAPPSQVLRPVASNGSVIVQQNGPALWHAGAVDPIVLTGITSPWGLSDDGSLLLYTSVTIGSDMASFSSRLMARNLATGKDIELVAGKPGELPQFMGVSSDGGRVLYRTTVRSPEGPAFVVDTSTGRSSALVLPDGELATEGTLSGSGNAVLLVTSTGRIVRIDVAGGTLTQVVAATPYIRNSYQFSPGSLVRLDSTLSHSAQALEGAILLNQLPLPILWATPGEIAAQIPWEVANSFEVPLRIDVSSDSPFQQNELVHISGMAPRFEGTAPAGVALPGVAIAADFSSLLTADPEPGQIFHTYMTGLGVVEGIPQTGVATPVGPLFPIRGRITCRFTPYTQDAETLFAGLAPGFIGIYQVTFRMPSGANPGKLTGGRCEVQSQNGGGFLIWGNMLQNP